MSYSKVALDIEKYYKYLLNKDEVKLLNKINLVIKDKKDDDIDDDVILFLNSLLEKIWENTLTDIDKYKKGDNFCFLIMDYVLLIPAFAEGNVSNFNFDTFKILTDKNIASKHIDEFGTIVKLKFNWNSKSVPILPIYFENKDSLIIKNANYEKIAYYGIDVKLEEYDIIKDYIDKLSQKEKKKALYLDKIYYRKKRNLPILTKDDLEILLQDLIVFYEENIKKNIDVHTKIQVLDKILNEQHKEVLNIFESYYNNQLSKEKLFEYISNIIEENILSYNKNKPEK